MFQGQQKELKRSLVKEIKTNDDRQIDTRKG